MTLSLFLRNKELHIATPATKQVYIPSDHHSLADEVPAFLNDILNSNTSFEKIIYSAGPASFTSMRIINSVIKAFYIANPQTQFIGVSNFFTYASIASKTTNVFTLAIPTMRGDYFVCSYNQSVLTPIEIKDIESNESDVIFDTAAIFDSINLASIQESILDLPIARNNPMFLQRNFDINYGFTPQY